MKKEKLEIVQLFGITIHNVNMEEAVSLIMDGWLSRSGEKHYVTTPNVDHVVKLQKDTEFLKIYQGASLVIADGMPVVWASRLLGQPLKERVAGSDLFPLLCEQAAAKNKTVYFLGSLPGVAERAIANLKNRLPNLQVAGFYSPPFGFEKDAQENEKIVRMINEAKPDLLFVALGAPKQEKWLHKHLQELDIKAGLCVGASLDFEAGEVKRAPRWMHGAGLEWLWRLMQDPARLWRRYLIEDPIFLSLCIGEFFKKESKKKNAGALNILLVAGMLFALSPSLKAATNSYPNILLNGALDQDADRDKRPDGWGHEGSIALARDGKESRALILQGDRKNPDASVFQRVEIPENAPRILTVRLLLKAEALQAAAPDQKGKACLTLDFYKKDGTLLKSRELAKWTGTLSWRPWAFSARIPDGAEAVEFRVLMQGATGKFLIARPELLWGLPEDYDLNNFVVDGGFEYPGVFTSWGTPENHQKFRYPGKDSSVRFEIDGPSVLKQQFTLGGQIADRAVAQIDVQLKNVSAQSENGGAQMEIDFQDANGKLLRSEVLGPWTGNHGWTHFSREIAVPEGSRQGEIRLLMESASGTADFDSVQLFLYAGQKALKRSFESRTETDGWIRFQVKKAPLQGALDASGLLDAPAGKNGFVTAGDDGHLYFENGKRARFWGINVQAPYTYPTHEEADLYAERIAQWGFNIVRLHHLDAQWSQPNLFDAKFDDTQHLSAEALDRLDYFIAALKKRGIYIYMDLLVSRRFKAGDGVKAFSHLGRGFKAPSQFNARLIELQKKYAQDLLMHKNPYTKLRLIDDPAIALMEIINESSLLRLEKGLDDIPQYYLDEMKKLWLADLERRGVKNAKTQGDRYLKFDDKDVQQFYAGIQSHYFVEMQTFLKGIGTKIPIAGSNFGMDGLDLQTNAQLDFIDRHSYWDPPKGGYGDTARFHNKLLLESLDEDNPVLKLSRLRVAGKPFAVTEWNIDWPNEYRAIGPVLMAAYASFQDWDAVIQFNFEGRVYPEKIEGNFDVGSKPDIFNQFAAASRIFHKSMVQSAAEDFSWPILSEEKISLNTALVSGISRTVSGKAAGQAPELPFDPTDPLASNTGELVWDAKSGLVTLDTPQAQAALGKFWGQTLGFTRMNLNLEPGFAAVSLVSLDDQPLAQSQHMLLSVSAKAENSGMIYNEARSFVRSSGKGPILQQPVKGSLFLMAGDSSKAEIYPLDVTGARLKAVSAPKQGSVFQLNLTDSFHYEILLGGEKK